MQKNPLRKLAASLQTLRAQHRERHRPSGFGFAFADRVDYLAGQTWDDVASHGSLFLQRKVLRVLEQHGPANIVPRYAIIFRNEHPAAIVAAQIVAVGGAQLRREKSVAQAQPSGSLLRRALSPAGRVAGAKLRERILVAGNLLSWGFDGIAFASGEEPAALWPAVAEALYRLRRAERLTGQTDYVLVKDVTEHQTGLESLRRFSYRPLETEPNMVLALDPAWRHYDDYLAALDAKYRRNSRDQLKRLAAAGCAIERLHDLKPHARRLHELYQEVHNNASVRLVTLAEGYLPALADALGDNFRCSVVRRGEELLGFVTCLRDGPTAVAYYIGFDREAASQSLPLYLRLLHSTIAHAIAWGCQRLSLGRTALEPKAGLGARPEPMSVWLRHRVPAMNVLLRALLRSVSHEEPPERNPFKAAPPQE
jgi:hypothetical protein